MNYIIVPSLKVVVRTNSEDLEDYEEELIGEIIDEDNVDTESVDIGDTEVRELTIKESYELYRYYKLVQSISGIDIDKFLLYWLKNKGINYEIDFDIDEKDYLNKGFNIISVDTEEGNE